MLNNNACPWIEKLVPCFPLAGYMINWYLQKHARVNYQKRINEVFFVVSRDYNVNNRRQDYELCNVRFSIVYNILFVLRYTF